MILDVCLISFFRVLRSGAAFYNFEPESGDFVAQVVQDIHVRILVVDNKFLNVSSISVHWLCEKAYCVAKYVLISLLR